MSAPEQAPRAPLVSAGPRCIECGTKKHLSWGGEFITENGVTRVRKVWKCSRCWGPGDWPERSAA